MSPAAAFAQGAGDDQYQDPIPDQPTTEQPQDGLDDAPPGGGGSGGGSGGSGGGSGGGAGSAGGTGSGAGGGTAGATDTAGATGAQATPGDGRALPNTGSEPILLASMGLVFLLIGAGLRLRTIDPDAY
jgi:LPXTG-motif cell wall-anchored protein